MDGGYQDGHAEAHWLAAQPEVIGASLGEIGCMAVMPSKLSKTTGKKSRVGTQAPAPDFVEMEISRGPSIGKLQHIAADPGQGLMFD